MGKLPIFLSPCFLHLAASFYFSSQSTVSSALPHLLLMSIQSARLNGFQFYPFLTNCSCFTRTGNELIYLDPHTTQIFVDSEENGAVDDHSFHCQQAPHRMKIMNLDPSVALVGVGRSGCLSPWPAALHPCGPYSTLLSILVFTIGTRMLSHPIMHRQLTLPYVKAPWFGYISKLPNILYTG